MRRAVVVLWVVCFAALVTLQAAPTRSTAGPVPQLTQTVPPLRAAYLPVIANLPTPTYTPTATAMPTATPTEVPGLPKFKNFNFEQGAVGWFQAPGNDIIITSNQVVPYSGQWLADLGGEGSSTDEIQQTIKLPAGRVIYLRFQRRIASRTDAANDFIIEVGGVQVKNETIGDITDTDGKWEIDVVDISAFAGQTVPIRFRVLTIHAIHVYLDDIVLSSHP
jgi:hypothetical protein